MSKGSLYSASLWALATDYWLKNCLGKEVPLCCCTMGCPEIAIICWILQKSRYLVIKKSVTLLPFRITIFTGVMWNFTRVWILVSLMIGDVKQHFTKLFKFFFENYLLMSVVHFLMSLLFCCWNFGLLYMSWVLASW